MLGFGVVFDCGHVAGFAADFAVGGFAGPGAGAVVTGFVDADGWLGPMLGFFHHRNVPCGAEDDRRVFTPWSVERGEATLSLR